MVKKLTNEEFLEKLERKNRKYKPLDEYKGSNIKICFMCDIHGEFLARPNDILNGQGCPKCGGTQKLTNEEFIAKANVVHNSFFSYDKCIYTNSNEKVTITCPIHGDFEQKANNHLNGQGCPKCKYEHIIHKITKQDKKETSTKKLTDSAFKERFKLKFGNKYDLSDTEYINNRTKIKPICSKHGTFEITPNHLMSGRGCPKCANNYHYTNDELVSKFKNIHGNKYSYKNIEYTSTHDKIDIICHKHGIFKQAISNHLSGQGCPICKSSLMENDIRKLLTDNDIKDFTEEQKFTWLGLQSLDFYIPSKKLAIECQGIQHFEPLLIFGGEKGFERRKMLDSKKSERCKENGIEIIYYADYDYDFPYEVIKDKNKLLSIILEKK